MFKTSILLITFVIGFMDIEAIQLNAQGGSSEDAQLPPAREIPGLTTPDQFPRACVDCHINYTEMNLDTRLSTVMERWRVAVEPEVIEAAQAVARDGTALTGVHPAVDTARSDVPGGCLSCHRNSRIPVPLVPLLHKLHLSDDSVFLRVFQGECTHCHKLDRTIAVWEVPNGREP